MQSYIDTFQRSGSATVQLTATSAVCMMLTPESKTTTWCSSSDGLCDCLKVTLTLICLTKTLTTSFPSFHKCLHKHIPFWTLCRTLKMRRTPFTPWEDNVFKETASPWRYTTKPELIDKLCVSKLSGQQEFTETLKSLSAITGIFFNHYHSSETAFSVLKLIHVPSVCQHIIDSQWVTDPRWFI